MRQRKSVGAIERDAITIEDKSMCGEKDERKRREHGLIEYREIKRKKR